MPMAERRIEMDEWCMHLRCLKFSAAISMCTYAKICQMTLFAHVYRKRKLASTRVSKEDLNRLVLNFLVIEGHKVHATLRTCAVVVFLCMRMNLAIMYLASHGQQQLKYVCCQSVSTIAHSGALSPESFLSQAQARATARALALSFSCSLPLSLSGLLSPRSLALALLHSLSRCLISLSI